MKKTLAGLAMLAIAAPAFAAEDEITVPALTPVPFVVGTTGDIILGHVKNWGTLGDAKNDGAKVATLAADQLQQGQCNLTLAVYRDAAGRVQSHDGLASISCPQSGGSITVLDVPGVILDQSGKQGLMTGKVGEKGFFLVQSAVSIPEDAK